MSVNIFDFAQDDSEQAGILIAETLGRDSAKFLNYGTHLYRGISQSTGRWRPFFKDIGHQNRVASGVSIDLEKSLDAMAEIIKSPVRRRNATFTYTTEYSAAEYGDSYLIFPIGDFDVLWNTRIFDAIDIDQDDIHHLTSYDSAANQQVIKNHVEDMLKHQFFNDALINLERSLIKQAKKKFNIGSDQMHYLRSMKSSHKNKFHDTIMASFSDYKKTPKYKDEYTEKLEGVQSSDQYSDDRVYDLEKMLNYYGPHFETDPANLKYNTSASPTEVLLKADEYYMVDSKFFEYFVEEHL